MKRFIQLFKVAIRYLFSGTVLINTKKSNKSVIRRGNRVYNSQIGKYTYITKGCLIQNAKIGSFCSISEECYIGMPSHPVEFVATSPVFLKGKNYLKCNFANIEYNAGEKTEIGNDVWIGVGVKVKGGVKIGDGAIIGAGAVVVKNVPPYAIVGGVPAKVIRYRFDEETVNKLLQLKWWDLPDEIIDVIQKVNVLDESEYVTPPEVKEFYSADGSLLEHLKLLLKITAQQQKTVSSIIASENDLKNFCHDDTSDVPFQHGWRYEIFGAKAKDLKDGKLSISYNPKTRLINFNNL